MKAIVRAEFDAHSSVATGDQSRDAAGKMCGEAIGLEALVRGGLQHDRWRRRRDVLDDRFTPTPMMWELSDVTGEIGRPSLRRGGQPRGGDRFDVAREEHARTRDMLNTGDQREIIVPRAPKLGVRPKEVPSRLADRDDIICRDRAYEDTRARHSLEKCSDRRHTRGGLHEGGMHDQLAGTSRAGDIKQRAEVIEIGMRDDHRIDPIALSKHHRKQSARGDTTDGTRAAIKEHCRVFASDEIRRPVTDSEHGDLKSRSLLFESNRCRAKCDHRHGTPRGDAPDPAPREKRGEHQDEQCASDPRCRDADLYRTTTHRN